MPPRKRLGQLLTELGVIDEHQLQSALGHQKQWGGKLGGILAAEPLLHEDAAELSAPLLLVSEGALELVLVDDAEFGEQLSEALARRHRGSRPYRLTRARYSSREKTPFSISSSTIALSAATDLRCVSSTPRRTSMALSRAGGEEAAFPFGGGVFCSARMSTTVLPALFMIFTDCSPSSRSSSSPRYQREMALRMALAPASCVSIFFPPVRETR